MCESNHECATSKAVGDGVCGNRRLRLTVKQGNLPDGRQEAIIGAASAEFLSRDQQLTLLLWPEPGDECGQNQEVTRQCKTDCDGPHRGEDVVIAGIAEGDG